MLLLLHPACSNPLGPPPFPTSYGLGGSGGIDAFIEPTTSVLYVGQAIDVTLRVYDSINGRNITDFGEVAWINENPSVVRLDSPLGACGSRCARITALAPGYAQLRARVVYEGVAVWGARGLRVFD